MRATTGSEHLGLSAELIENFEACTMPPGSFDHRTHVQVTWLYLRECSVLEALQKVCAGLQRFTRAVGAEEKYHETISVAFVLLIRERMSALGLNHSWAEFEQENGDLFVKSPSPLSRYYQPETLSSQKARRAFMMPDRAL